MSGSRAENGRTLALVTVATCLVLLTLVAHAHADELRLAAYGDTRARATMTAALTLDHLPAGLSSYGFVDLVTDESDPEDRSYFWEHRLDYALASWLAIEGEVNVLPGSHPVTRAGPVLHRQLGPLHAFVRLFPWDSQATGQASLVVLGEWGRWQTENFVDWNIPYDGQDDFFIAEAEVRYWIWEHVGIAAEFRHDTTGGGDGVGLGVAWRWRR